MMIQNGQEQIKQQQPEPEQPTGIIIGYFNEYGYKIEIAKPNNNFETVYAAGNNKFDSGLSQTVDPIHGLDLATIKKFCKQTGEEIAQERGLKFGGIEKIEDEQEEKFNPNYLNALVCSPVQDEAGNTEAYFSRQTCENCGDHLAGNRYDITYRETLKGDILEASVCQDCFISLCS